MSCEIGRMRRMKKTLRLRQRCSCIRLPRLTLLLPVAGNDGLMLPPLVSPAAVCIGRDIGVNVVIINETPWSCV